MKVKKRINKRPNFQLNPNLLIRDLAFKVDSQIPKITDQQTKTNKSIIINIISKYR